MKRSKGGQRRQWQWVVLSNRLLARQGLASRPGAAAAAPGAAAADDAAAVSTAAAALTEHTLFDQGVTRRYCLYVPAALPAHSRVPLLLLFHGGYGSGRRLAERVGMNALAEREGFIVVYPDAVDGHWNDGRATTDSPVDDVAFVARLIDGLASVHPIDRSRVYAAGISNGGALAARLACEMSERLAAIAQVVSTMPQELLRSGRPEHPVPVLFVNGVDDPILPWEGGDLSERRRLGKGGPVVSADEAVAFWVAANGCEPTPRRETLAGTGERAGRIERIRYGEAAQGNRVELLAIEGGGHTWPGSPERPWLKEIVGPTSAELDASEVIWEFLSAHRRGR